MAYDFDKIINRENTSSIKLTKCPEGSTPLWIADMDFACADEIVDALVNRSKHAIFGYTEYSDDLKESAQKWFFDNYKVTYEKEWMCYSPGIVTAMSFLIEALTEPGDSILIQQPVYHPFKNQIVNNDRKMISSDLEDNDGYYTINFMDLEAKLAKPEVKGMILCSPHNPVGRVWSKVELRIMVDIAKAYGKWIICDEIHCDLARTGVEHTPILAMAEDYKENIIVCTAPSKTFNIAGFQLSNIIIPSEEIRNKYKKIAESKYEIALPNAMSLVAAKAAYDFGGQWLTELKLYLDESINYVMEFFLTNFPLCKLSPCEATYLMWVDLSEYLEGGSAARWKDIPDMMQQCKVLFNDGEMFGPSGRGHIRINVASPRKILSEALNKML